MQQPQHKNTMANKRFVADLAVASLKGFFLGTPMGTWLNQ